MADLPKLPCFLQHPIPFFIKPFPLPVFPLSHFTYVIPFSLLITFLTLQWSLFSYLVSTVTPIWVYKTRVIAWICKERDITLYLPFGVRVMSLSIHFAISSDLHTNFISFYSLIKWDGVYIQHFLTHLPLNRHWGWFLSNCCEESRNERDYSRSLVWDIFLWVYV